MAIWGFVIEDEHCDSVSVFCRDVSVILALETDLGASATKEHTTGMFLWKAFYESNFGAERANRARACSFNLMLRE